jgi:DNA polymerase-3 subunit delta'
VSTAVATTFSDIFGQGQAVSAIQRAFRSGRLPHGLLFAGPSGVGKQTTAGVLARLALCENPRDAEPCNACQACTLVSAGTHPDLHVVYRQLVRLENADAKARDLTVQVIRDHLVAPANLKSSLGRGKAFIVHEADSMNVAAQNALLKTLEEPSGPTVIVLLTDSLEALLPTIRSRCQVVRFAPLDPAIVQRELTARGHDASLAREAAALADGSLGLALHWIEDGVIVRARELLERIDEVWAAKTSSSWIGDFLKSAGEAYADRALERDPKASKDQATREGYAVYLRILAQHFRMKLRDGGDADTLDRACRAIEAVRASEQYIDTNVNAQLVFLQLASALRRARPAG